MQNNQLPTNTPLTHVECQMFQKVTSCVQVQKDFVTLNVPKPLMFR